MHISWLGTTCLKIQTKPQDKDITIIIDPYKPAAGTFPRSLSPNIVVYTRGDNESVTISGDPFILSTPGEIETDNVLMTAVQGHSANSIIARIDTEGVSVAHLGLTKEMPTDAQLEAISGIDVLCIPVGHPDSYDSDQAAKVVNTIEPRIIIPIAGKSDNDTKAAPVDSFVKELGGTVEPETKVIIKKSTLPQEDMQIIVLAKE